MLLNKVSILALAVVFAACSSSKKTGAEQTKQDNIDYANTPAIVYKTTHDYSQQVPVTLSDDKSKIVAYPAPADVFYKGKLAYPTSLANGYLLDNRGLTATTAFTKYTYQEYAKLAAAPNIATLFAAIIDNNPIKEMYNCGNRTRFTDEINELNKLIKDKQLKTYKKIK